MVLNNISGVAVLSQFPFVLTGKMKSYPIKSKKAALHIFRAGLDLLDILIKMMKRVAIVTLQKGLYASFESVIRWL